MMTHVFLPFPFSQPEVLAHLCARTDAALPARLPGYRLRIEDHIWLPAPYSVPNAAPDHDGVEGVVVEMSTRIEDLAVKLGWRCAPVPILMDGKTASYLALLPEPAPPTAPAKEGAVDDPTVDAMERWRAGLFQQVWAELKDRPATDQRPRFPMILARATARLAAQNTAPTTVRTDLGIDLVRNCRVHLAHDGFFQFRQTDLRHPRFDGGLSALVTRETFVGTDAAIVLPYDPVRDRVLLVEQFRMGPFERGDPLPFCLEPVAGRVDAGEDPETTARRECFEEAGLELRDLLHISSHYASPGASTEYMHCYLGLCDLPQLEQGTGGLDDEHEDIRTHVLPFAQAFDLIATGEANIGPLVTTLLWLDRERPRLRSCA